MFEVDLFHSCSVNNELTAPSLGEGGGGAQLVGPGLHINKTKGAGLHASSGGLYVCTFLTILH